MNPESDNPEEMEQCLDLLYQHRETAIDPECTWNIRNDAWVAIDGLLDWFNELRGVQGGYEATE